MLNSALAIIRDEHRSLAAVIHGLRYLVREMRERNATPNFRLLWAMMLYLDEFPARMHRPKENEVSVEANASFIGVKRSGRN